jgi:seryl-tRNA synthetase
MEEDTARKLETIERQRLEQQQLTAERAEMQEQMDAMRAHTHARESELQELLAAIPPELAEWSPTLRADGNELEYVFDSNLENTGVPSLLRRLSDLGIAFKDLHTSQSSLEDIFVSLVHGDRTTGAAA